MTLAALVRFAASSLQQFEMRPFSHPLCIGSDDHKCPSSTKLPKKFLLGLDTGSCRRFICLTAPLQLDPRFGGLHSDAILEKEIAKRYGFSNPVGAVGVLVHTFDALFESRNGLLNTGARETRSFCARQRLPCWCGHPYMRSMAGLHVALRL